MDLSFVTESGRFNYRVGAIIQDCGKLLLHKNAHYYATIGGRVKLGESSETAIIRELKEELQLDFEVDRLGFVDETFYAEDGKNYHEMSFFYYIKPLTNISAIALSYNDDGTPRTDVELVWIPLDKLANYEVYPPFFKTELLKPEKSVRHIIDDRRGATK